MLKICYQVSTPEVYRKPGITSYQADLDFAFRFLKDCGYDDVELMVRDPKVLKLAEIEKHVEKANFSVPMICTGEIYGQDKLSFSDPDPSKHQEAVDRVMAAIDMASVFGKKINIGRVRGGYLPEVPKEVTYARIVDTILKIVDYATKKGVYIALEPVNSLALNFINSTMEGIEFVKKIDSHYFQIMLDTAHMCLEDKSIEDSIKQAKDYLLFVHIADSNRKYPGAGTFNFHYFFSVLKQINYQHEIGVEVFPFPDQDTAALESIRFLKSILEKY